MPKGKLLGVIFFILLKQRAVLEMAHNTKLTVVITQAAGCFLNPLPASPEFGGGAAIHRGVVLPPR
jgi:hypothetical protein